jgi:excisionase family DNA binding protein
MAHMKPTQYITCREAAERLHVSPKSIRRRIAEGDLTGYRIGPKALRVDAAEVEALARPVTIRRPA